MKAMTPQLRRIHDEFHDFLVDHERSAYVDKNTAAILMLVGEVRELTAAVYGVDSTLSQIRMNL
jgi:hypothetical protein